MERTGGAASGARLNVDARHLVIFFSNAFLFALLIALSARTSLVIPGTPVPATLQTLAVLVAGGLLGPLGGVVSVATYLGAGLAGAPVFASGWGAACLFGPTGGYLMGLLPAAWLAGHFSQRSIRMRVLIPGFLLAALTIEALGWTQLSAIAGNVNALNLGVTPFLALDALKAVLGAGIVRLVRTGRMKAILPPGMGRP